MPTAHARLEFGPGLAVLIGGHLALDLALTQPSWFWSEPTRLLAIALPLSQLSLVTIWATVVLKNPALRHGVVILGAVWCWYLLSMLLPWGIGEPASAGWALALVFQAATLFGALACTKTIRFPAFAAATPANATHAPIRFGIGDIILWTTSVAVAFGVIQLGKQRWNWNEDVFQWEFISVVPIIGIAQGLLATLWLWAFATSGTNSYLRMLVGILFSAGIGISQCFFSGWIAGVYVMELRSSLTLVAGQSCVLVVSLAVAKSNYIQPTEALTDR